MEKEAHCLCKKHEGKILSLPASAADSGMKLSCNNEKLSIPLKLWGSIFILSCSAASLTDNRFKNFKEVNF